MSPLNSRVDVGGSRHDATAARVLTPLSVSVSPAWAPLIMTVAPASVVPLASVTERVESATTAPLVEVTVGAGAAPTETTGSAKVSMVLLTAALLAEMASVTV